MSAEEIARGLTEAQREAIVSGKRLQSQAVNGLWKKRLVTLAAAGRRNKAPQLTPLGLEVRAILENERTDHE